MSNSDTQSINSIVCNLNSKVDDVDAMITAIELMLCEIRIDETTEERKLLRSQLSHIHCLACIAIERSKEAVELGYLADSSTTGLRFTAAVA